MFSAAESRTDKATPHVARFVLLMCAIFGVAIGTTGWAERKARSYRGEHSGKNFTYIRNSPVLDLPSHAGCAGLGAIALFVIVEVLFRRWSPRWLLSLLAVVAAFLWIVIGLSMTQEMYFL